MSANRSVQAAQRRQFKQEPVIRGPQPSINSAQMFANQARPGPGPNIPNGRLAGQQVAYQQQQMQQMQQQQMQPQYEQKDGLEGISKLTVAQAITLITLRLGAVESKLLNGEHPITDSSINASQIDPSLFDNILSRLDELEKNSSNELSPSQSSSSNNSVLSADVSMLKQQFEPVKQSAIQTKTAINSLIKDNKDTKFQLESLKNELQDTKNLVSHLQQMIIDMENRLLLGSQKQEYNYDDNSGHESTIGTSAIDFTNINTISTVDNVEVENYSDILETNLKEIIENEINLEQ